MTTYNVYKTKHPKLLHDGLSMFDLGFLEVEKYFPQQKSSLPIKKEKGCEITAEQKKITTRTIPQRGWW
jgi:hypothetical protein